MADRATSCRKAGHSSLKAPFVIPNSNKTNPENLLIVNLTAKVFRKDINLFFYGENSFGG
jgi:hypothetical protein